MECIPVYGLISRLIRTYSCINKICGMYGNPSMATDTSYNSPHLSGDGVSVMVCDSYKIWSYSVGGLWPGWRASTCMCYIPGLSHPSYASTRCVKMMATNPWSLVPCITSHTSVGMNWWFTSDMMGKWWRFIHMTYRAWFWFPSWGIQAQSSWKTTSVKKSWHLLVSNLGRHLQVESGYRMYMVYHAHLEYGYV